MLEKEEWETVLTAKGNDGGADVVAIANGNARLFQVKHSCGQLEITSSAVDDIISAGNTYQQELATPASLAIATNSVLARRARLDANHSRIDVIEREEL